MIRVRCVGHIATSLGRESLELDLEEIQVGDLIESLRALAIEPERVGFSRFNTLAMVGGGEAFVAGSKDRVLNMGESVVLIPFSHGGCLYAVGVDRRGVVSSRLGGCMGSP